MRNPLNALAVSLMDGLNEANGYMPKKLTPKQMRNRILFSTVVFPAIVAIAAIAR